MVATLAIAAPAGAQAPPPGGMVEVERSYGLGLGLAGLRWDDESIPFDDTALVSLSIERDLWRGMSGRASIARGSSTLTGEEEGAIDAGVWSLDLQVLLALEFGPLARLPVLPYAIGGVGSLVTNPSGEGGLDLPTRSQSQWSYGAGVRARIASRWEAVVEGTGVGVRFADPFTPENRETRTIHNIRWEGRLQWRF